MNDNPRANGSRGHDPYAALRLIALIAAIAGVVVLAAAAFVLSYGGIHKIALSAGVSPSVARIFPVIFDAMLVVSCAAVVSLRSAGWWPRTYSWLTTLALLVVVAAADAAHATGTHIPRKPAAATVAILPWALLLLAFTLLLSMLRQFRRTRAAAAGALATDSAAVGTARVGVPSATRPGLDILAPRGPVQQPDVAGTAPTGTTPAGTTPAGHPPAGPSPAGPSPAGRPRPPVPRRPGPRTSAPWLLSRQRAPRRPRPARIPSQLPTSRPRKVRYGVPTLTSSRRETLSSQRPLVAHNGRNRQSRSPGWAKRPAAAWRLRPR